ncbi:hypothetical protein BTVI_00909 [Pitangus sulphuratus]|nr:hypothetical protein BTVI_00909 [Pitangus sulphuratus]
MKITLTFIIITITPGMKMPPITSAAVAVAEGRKATVTTGRRRKMGVKMGVKMMKVEPRAPGRGMKVSDAAGRRRRRRRRRRGMGDDDEGWMVMVMMMKVG